MYALTACRVGKVKEAYPLFLKSAGADVLCDGKAWAGMFSSAVPILRRQRAHGKLQSLGLRGYYAAAEQSAQHRICRKASQKSVFPSSFETKNTRDRHGGRG
jgi:hypothetical protein